MEDAKIAFNLFCCVYGVGTLGMPGDFSRAGPAIVIVVCSSWLLPTCGRSSLPLYTAARRGYGVGRLDGGHREGDADKEAEAEAAEYRGTNSIRYVLLRVAIVALQIIASVLLKDHFSGLSDFVGSSAITMSCIILPIIFYLKSCWDRVPLYEKVPALFVVVVFFVLGCYVTYLSRKELFAPSDSEVNFPFCAPEYLEDVY